MGPLRVESKAQQQAEADLRKLLDYANYFGLGKSRSIGFGEVKLMISRENTDGSHDKRAGY
ncbi:CRISPR system precrRNA processing endoribonuclease RAMP protein Cas6 [Metallosphaera hakonensis]|uniref:CRISPR system precrRNA processing endoribonuclease RAMP protein Cas6 n=1 Tax=Metallosphaera hakonensis TaxID=79601 RepID=UPI002092BCEE|nr:CRISPR system precrRNA processing endoribonuclease RAMP protein Cas6 [Metallosphaera hakonensis]